MGRTTLRSEWHTPAQAIRDYAEYIKVLHVHDNDGEYDYHYAPFCGKIDWQDFSSALYETGFDGVFAPECEPCLNLPDDILADMYSIYARIAKAVIDLGSKK